MAVAAGRIHGVGVNSAERTAGGETAAQETRLFQQIQEDVDRYRQLGLWSQNGSALIPKWKRLLEKEPGRFVAEDGTLMPESLRTFRRDQVFVPDIPGYFDPNRWALRNILDGGRRGIRRTLMECVAITEREGYGELLRRYPCHPVGQPRMLTSGGRRFTVRWLKHIYYLGLVKTYLSDQLQQPSVVLDLGSSYGIFPYLVHREFPGTRVILVDFPEQLILARYFLGSCLPQARIGGIHELTRQPNVTRVSLEPYDFLLVPVQRFHQLAGGLVDIVSNFASLGEMSRTAFNGYIQSEVFRAARYFFTVNRVQSAPDYDTDLTIVDYPIWDSSKRIHFRLWPVIPHTYEYRRAFFFYDRYTFPPYFEYLGRL